MSVRVLVIGIVVLTVGTALWLYAEYQMRHPEAIARRRQRRTRARINAWEQAELDRVGPEIFYGSERPDLKG